MKQNKKVLMTSDKTWISKEAWDFQKKSSERWMEFIYGEDLKESYPPANNTPLEKKSIFSMRSFGRRLLR